MPLLREVAPHLRVEWDASQNASLKLKFDTIPSTSNKRAWWSCSKDSRHGWRSLVRDRANGRGCPYCFGRQVLPEDSLGSRFPSLCAEIDVVRSPDLDVNSIPPGSKKEIWWKCPKDKSHSWRRAIRRRTINDQGCPQCHVASKSLARKAPGIAAYWHNEKNFPRTPETVYAHSKEKAWWICKSDPEHVWEAAICSRVNEKSNCPHCLKLRGSAALPSLLKFDTVLAQQWHPTKNGTLSPADVTAGTHRKVWWQCPGDSNHEWEANVRNRARLGRGCPFCAKHSARTTIGNSLEKMFPALASQWHPEKNGTLTPAGFLPGSGVRVWWRCLGETAHEWETSIYHRTSRQPNGECAFCRKTRLSEANSLAVIHPDVAAEWHPELNGELTPHDVTRASGKRVWWQCLKNPTHVWDTKIRARTIHRSGCPLCSLEGGAARMQQAYLDAAHWNANSLKTFKNHLTSVRDLLRQVKPTSSQMIQAFYRMIYASVITALETYLADTFFRLVVDSADRTEKLLTTAPEFLEKRYSMTEVIDWQKNLPVRIAEYLHGIAWHNLRKVRPMYEVVLGVAFPGEFGDVCRAVMIRHDIVHRNGRSKEHRVHRLTNQDLLDLVMLADKFVGKIEAQVSSSDEKSD
jgi:hypothetical protein